MTPPSTFTKPTITYIVAVSVDGIHVYPLVYVASSGGLYD
jgi:hypothetical protein